MEGAHNMKSILGAIALSILSILSVKADDTCLIQNTLKFHNEVNVPQIKQFLTGVTHEFSGDGLKAVFDQIGKEQNAPPMVVGKDGDYAIFHEHMSGEYIGILFKDNCRVAISRFPKEAVETFVRKVNGI
jgi:hypothetical protein